MRKVHANVHAVFLAQDGKQIMKWYIQLSSNTYYNTGTYSNSLAHNLIIAFHQVHILATKSYQFSLYGDRKYHILGTTIYPPFTKNKKKSKILSKKHVNKFQIFVKCSTFMT